MVSIRRKARRAKKSGRRRGPRRILLRLAFRLARPFAPGLIAGAAGSYFLDKTRGASRRQKALGAVGAVTGKAKARKG